MQSGEDWISGTCIKEQPYSQQGIGGRKGGKERKELGSFDYGSNCTLNKSVKSHASREAKVPEL